MIDLMAPIVPNKGAGIFNLDASYDEIKALIRAKNIPHVEETASPTDMNPPWTIIALRADGARFESIELFFVEGRLFQICLSEDFKGALPNGIRLGMNIDAARAIDERLRPRDDAEEIYESAEGYRLETFGRRREIVEIMIFSDAQ